MNLLKRFQIAATVLAGGEREPAAQGIKTSKDLRKYLDYHNGTMSPLQVSGILRCVDILSSCFAMLPFRVIDPETFEVQKDHPLYEKLMFEPNNWQTAFEFKRLMELRRIMQGDAFALIIKSGTRISALQPIARNRVEVKQRNNWSVYYRVRRPDNTWTEVESDGMLHLRDISVEGLEGISRTKLVQNAIRTLEAADKAQRNIFETGNMAGGYFKHKGELGDKAFNRLKAQMDERTGPEEAGKWWLLEDDMDAEKLSMSARDAQTGEVRDDVLEDIARAFGVPRPLMMMDDTSWGSGVKELGTMFVRYGLAPGFISWEQSGRRVLLTREEKRNYALDVDESVLLRGSIVDQGEYFAKALGSGGHRGWMTGNEVRKATGLPNHSDGDNLEKAGEKENAEIN